jgi:predicted ATP-grasp superfamily ATP-dependent carboligase
MVLKLEKFKFNAEILRIEGFALMSPLGTLIINFVATEMNIQEFINLKLIMFLVGNRFLTQAGIIMEKRDAIIDKF